jgi:hypothetical protein
MNEAEIIGRLAAIELDRAQLIDRLRRLESARESSMIEAIWGRLQGFELNQSQFIVRLRGLETGLRNLEVSERSEEILRRFEIFELRHGQLISRLREVESRNSGQPKRSSNSYFVIALVAGVIAWLFHQYFQWSPSVLLGLFFALLLQIVLRR